MTEDEYNRLEDIDKLRFLVNDAVTKATRNFVEKYGPDALRKIPTSMKEWNLKNKRMK